MVIEGLKNLDSPNRTDPFIISHAAHPAATCGSGSDAADAFMLTDYARTDGHRLRRVEPLAQATRELAALVRPRTSLIEARTAASNQVWAVLAEHWPGAALVFQKLTSQIALALLDRLSDTPGSLTAWRGTDASVCRRHSYRGGKSR